MTPEERQASIEATATERAATLNLPVHHVIAADLHKRVSELEGKPFQGDPANDFHLKGNALDDLHGKARAKFIQKLSQAGIIEDTWIPLFLKYLNEYEVDGSGDPPYDVEELAAMGEAQNQPFDGSGTDRWGASDWTDAGHDIDGYPVEKGSDEDVSEKYRDNPNVPTQEEADAITFPNGRPVNPQTEFEQVAYEQNGVDVRPSEEKTNG